MSRTTFRQWMMWVGVFALLVLQGCTTPGVGFITGARFAALEHVFDSLCDSEDGRDRARCTEARFDALVKFAPRSTTPPDPADRVFLEIDGFGLCGELSIDFGDGSPAETFMNMPLSNGMRFSHTYTGWPGTKIARVTAGQNCNGSRTAEVLVGFRPDARDEFRAGYQASKTAFCIADPAMPILRPGTVVRITTDGAKIRYGLPVFDASGDPNAVTPLNYPFTSMRMFSIVYRVGTETFQGEAGPKLFRVTQRAALEVCVNDHPTTLFDNSGGMLLTIKVNEGSATGP